MGEGGERYIKAVWILAGFLLLTLGAIGLIVPVLPTTPFLIGAAACFAAAPKIREWMLGIPIFGEHIENYRNKTGLKKSTVAFSLGFLWVMLTASCLLVPFGYLTALLIAVGTAVTIHIIAVSRPGRGRKKQGEKNDENNETEPL